MTCYPDHWNHWDILEWLAIKSMFGLPLDEGERSVLEAGKAAIAASMGEDE